MLSEVFRVPEAGRQDGCFRYCHRRPAADDIKNSLTAWAGCIAGALDVRDYELRWRRQALADITVTPSYFDEADH